MSESTKDEADTGAQFAGMAFCHGNNLLFFIAIFSLTTESVLFFDIPNFLGYQISTHQEQPSCTNRANPGHGGCEDVPHLEKQRDFSMTNLENTSPH
jgi:hypothetical protein